MHIDHHDSGQLPVLVRRVCCLFIHGQRQIRNLHVAGNQIADETGNRDVIVVRRLCTDGHSVRAHMLPARVAVICTHV